jgi:hypothetical protein
MLLDAWFSNKAEIRHALSSPGGQVFLEGLREWREYHIGRMKNAKDLLELGRAQGALEVVDRLLNLREELSK